MRLWLLCSSKSSSNRNRSPSAAYHVAKGQLTFLAIASTWTTVSPGELKGWRALGVIPRQQQPAPPCCCDSFTGRSWVSCRWCHSKPCYLAAFLFPCGREALCAATATGGHEPSAHQGYLTRSVCGLHLRVTNWLSLGLVTWATNSWQSHAVSLCQNLC